MKKLMVVIATIGMTIMSEAAISWRSGNLYVAKDANGGWDNSATSQLIGKQGVTAYIAAILVDSDTYTSLSSSSQKDIWKTYGNSDITKIGDGYKNSAQVKTTGTTHNGMPETEAEKNTTYYAVILAAYHDDTYNKDFYLATTATATASATAAGSASNILSAKGAASSDGGWQAVPEPTSAMLLMLGLCGLALKRKNA